MNNTNLTKFLRFPLKYDLRNNPRLIQFSDGSQTKYVYTANGEKLRTINRKASPNIQVALGKTKVLQPGVVLERDSTDYINNFVLNNGKPSKYLFAGGFYSYPAYAGNGLPSLALPPSLGGAGEGRIGNGLFFYLTDHLGNNRVVVDSNDSIVQSVHYYPFGAVYADAGFNPNFQKYKYTGKELDLTHGLNTYDHGARQNYSILGVWDRIDPMAEKYYNISPYVVCGNNPLFIMDSKGDSLTLLGTLSDINSAIDIYNKGLGGFYTVSANDNGNLSIQAVDGTDPSKMSPSQKAVSEKLKTIIDNEGNTILNVTNNSEGTLIGDISKHEIDVGDMQKLENQKELNDVSSIMHETYENYQVQVLNSNINYAHRKASELEYRITGYFIPPFERDIESNSLKLHVLIPSDYYKYIRPKGDCPWQADAAA